MISVDDALALLAKHQLQLPSETVDLDAVLGRILARDVAAKVTLPPYASSAMDGYAVRFSDISGGADSFRVIGEAPAGHPFDGAVGAGEAVRIFTGSRVPEGADHIVIQENVARSGETITLTEAGEGARGPRHIRAGATDFSAGDILLPAGLNLGPGEIAAAAAGDHASVEVQRQPKVAIIANGDELRPPGSNPASGDIVASNYFGLGALVRRWGGQPVNTGIAADSIDAICDRIEAASDADILVPVGGASVGDHDHMAAAFERLGAETLFRKIAVKPGKPTWLGRLGQKYILGLPGNPASAYVCAQIFLRVLMLGQGSLDWRTAKLAHDIPAEGGRETFVRARSFVDGDGAYRVQMLDRQDSSLITPFLTADCLMRRAANAPPMKAGEAVSVMMLQR